MTAIAYTETLAPLADPSPVVNAMDGAGVEMFTNGLGTTSADMMSGEGIDLFTTSCITAGHSIGEGDQVGLFSSTG